MSDFETRDHERAAVLARCRQQGLRRTRALEGVVAILLETPQPLTLNQLAEKLENQFDRATVYRLVIRLEGIGLVRRLGFHDRSTHYAMRFKDRHDDYLICTECGSIEILNIGCPVAAMESVVESQFGFRRIYHELEFFGVCPGCSDEG